MSRKSFGDFDVVSGPPAISRPVPPAAPPAAPTPAALNTPTAPAAKPEHAGRQDKPAA